MTFDDVAALALALPGSSLGTSYGTAAVKVRAKTDGSGGKLLARLRDDGDLVLRCEDGLRDALIATQPDVFYLTPHYAGYDWVLVRLAAADAGQLAGLVERAWAGLATARLRTMRAGTITAP